MPQEFHVIRCYSCETFQVHIVKKSNKWECKMCGEKQSLKKVYFQGSGKDCRLNVQKLNETRILNEENQKVPETIEIKTEEQEVHENSKWDEFLPKNKESSDEEDERSNYTFNRPNKRKSLTKLTKNETKKIKLNNDEIQNTEDVIDTPGPSKWKNFISNIENKPNNSEKEENSKNSKWDCFVDNESDDDNEIPDKGETNVTLNKDSNIFSSNDNNLDDILNL